MRKLLLAAAVLCTATAAQASIVPVLLSVTPEGDLFRYSYQGTLSGDSGVTTGSKLVIFDFAGFSGGFQVPSPFITASTELSSGMFSPGNTDDPNIENLVFTWNGPDFHTSGGEFDQTQFEGLSVLSTANLVGLDGYSATTIKNNGEATGTPEVNAGTVEVPLFAAGVPEPATWGLMILGLGGVGSMVRRRRRGQTAFA